MVTDEEAVCRHAKSKQYLRQYKSDFAHNVSTGSKKKPPPPRRQKVRRSRRFSIDFEGPNPPQIKRHLGLRTTGQPFHTTQQENYCDWPIPKWGCLIGGALLHILIIWGKLGRIQKTWFLAKRGCLIEGEY